MFKTGNSVVFCAGVLFLVGFGNLSLGITVSQKDYLPLSSKARSKKIVANLESNSQSIEGVISQQNSDLPSFRQSRPAKRKPVISEDRYPSPHGKDARWRFDLRHTVDSDLSVQLPSSSILARIPSRNTM
jgi:hypothetical protein